MTLNYFEGILGISPTVSTLLVLLLGILYFILKNRDLPPGPTGLPFVGYWPFLEYEDLHLQALGKKYGDIYSFSIIGNLFIVLGSMKFLKEAYVTKADSFAKRHEHFSLFSMVFGDGIVTKNGEEWKTLRKFFIQAFKEHGLISTREHMSGPIYNSVNASVEDIMATKGSLFDIYSTIRDRSSEIFRRMVFNDEGITDEELKGVLECYEKTFVIFEGKTLFLMGRFARYFVLPAVKGYKAALENRKKMEEYLTKLVRRHEQTYSEGNVRDIIDSYIKERNEKLKKGDSSAEYFSELALVSSLIQIVGDGILGVDIFIVYFIRALLEYPDEQEKIYKELEEVIGSDRQITLEDRNKLPYTNAFMQEVIRTTDFVPVFISLECTKETTLNGHRIPKGALTVMNLWSCNHDPEVFHEPDKFKPSRYISESEKPKEETPILFGMGKRSCVGESFTMMQVFLFLANIIKNFRLECPEENIKNFFMDGTVEVYAHARK